VNKAFGLQTFRLVKIFISKFPPLFGRRNVIKSQFFGFLLFKRFLNFPSRSLSQTRHSSIAFSRSCGELAG
jgi:hypothetical protein